MSSGAVLRLDPALLARHPHLYGSDAATQMRRLADALTCGPMWGLLAPRLALAVRTEPEPIIAVLGEPTPIDGPRIQALSWQVPDTLRRLRPVGTSEVVTLCAKLADRLVDRFGQDISSAYLLGVPRGGLVIAGLLACALGIPAARVQSLASGADEDRLVIVVDDCSLSGTRIRRWLRDHPGRRIVVALLHASAGLRSAVEADRRVIACVVIDELHDHAPTREGADYARWVQRWRQRSRDDFWIGHPDRVVYPWNEPDVAIWNSETERAEPGWRVVPPQWCLKNRSATPPPSATAQLCVSSQGPLRASAGVVWAWARQTVLIAHGESGKVTRADGVGASCWEALMTTGDAIAAAEKIAREYDQPLSRVQADVDAFIDRCRTHRLLTGPAAQTMRTSSS